MSRTLSENGKLDWKKKLTSEEIQAKLQRNFVTEKKHATPLGQSSAKANWKVIESLLERKKPMIEEEKTQRILNFDQDNIDFVFEDSFVRVNEDQQAYIKHLQEKQNRELEAKHRFSERKSINVLLRKILDLELFEKFKEGRILPVVPDTFVSHHDYLRTWETLFENEVLNIIVNSKRADEKVSQYET